MYKFIFSTWSGGDIILYGKDFRMELHGFYIKSLFDVWLPYSWDSIKSTIEVEHLSKMVLSRGLMEGER